ncbi:bifunctional riboflavin kinase/FAD synthetase [Tichowtungia aerotolerans]|uniref:Riboflavin biosynthesis protein n=1 Tax=Tichowtungia aerotolerans TaxID=2697043 RepID=A0A6P1M091_9BACT|nr:bifunctional riboflavin kinase/FAD synthetase [Tichowtungia aerotolerans]QHI68219.1 bifunctional riboflavin kinase/FAD synthetase [Tichowtungia aerotolerans]
MLIVTDISKTSSGNKPIILAMGCFDGVHLGHQKVISTAVEQAAELGGEAWVYTFDPHPAKVLVPEKAPPLISAKPCRLRKVEDLGVSGVIETPFTREFAALSPEDFLNDLIAKAPQLAGIVCGEDWSFGHRASGNFQTLETFGKTHGFKATAVSPLMDGDKKISSSTIRKDLAAGNIPDAARLLGRPFTLFGKVVSGKKIGRELGFPTANIDPLNELIPGNGVYAARTLTNGTWVDSAVFIGNRETFGCHQHVIESYLIGFNGDLYGKDLEVVLIEKIRGVSPFPSREALIEQIEKDVAQIRKLLVKNSNF